jgi:iron complex outermembrane receptor protein
MLGNSDGFVQEQAVMNIKSNLILNAKASYKINENFTPYITLKNLLGNHREYGFADQVGSLFLVGIRWEL